jgi:integrase
VLGDAARQDLLPRNPCRFVRPLPTEHRELPYLRLNEIDRYLRACPAHYRPLAELLIGTGARTSEALALTWPDIDLDHATVQIQRQRARHGDSTTQTKGKRAHTVLIRPRLTETLRTLRNTTHRANMGGGSNPLRRITGAPRSRGSPRSEAVRAGALEASPCRVRTA